MSSLRRTTAFATALLAIISVLGLFGRVWWFLDLFAHFRMQLGVALVMCVAVSWFLRQPRVTLLASMFSLFNFIIVAPQLVYQPTAEARAQDTVRLVHVNINKYNRESSHPSSGSAPSRPCSWVI